jgi:biotin/methionine sulfoxide reductase
MKQAIAPIGEARDDYAVFADLADRFGSREAFTEGRNVHPLRSAFRYT